MTTKPIDTTYDIEADPTADEFDPIAWFLGTGEDLGVPPDWLAEYRRIQAESPKVVAELTQT